MANDFHFPKASAGFENSIVNGTDSLDAVGVATSGMVLGDRISLRACG